MLARLLKLKPKNINLTWKSGERKTVAKAHPSEKSSGQTFLFLSVK